MICLGHHLLRCSLLGRQAAVACRATSIPGYTEELYTLRRAAAQPCGRGDWTGTGKTTELSQHSHQFLLSTDQKSGFLQYYQQLYPEFYTKEVYFFKCKQKKESCVSVTVSLPQRSSDFSSEGRHSHTLFQCCQGGLCHTAPHLPHIACFQRGAWGTHLQIAAFHTVPKNPWERKQAVEEIVCIVLGGHTRPTAIKMCTAAPGVATNSHFWLSSSHACLYSNQNSICSLHHLHSYWDP